MSDATVTLVSPDGRKVVGPKSGAAALIDRGYRELNAAELEEEAKREKYGGALGKAGAAVSGLASGATFGGSDLALQQAAKGNTLVSNLLKPVQEANAAAAEVNPEYHAAGQIASLALPIAGELGAGGKLVKAAGEGINTVGKASQTAGKLASAVAPKAIKPLVSGAVQAGAEGAAFQVGSNISEAARRDVPLDAETILAHAGEGAFLGAGLGAALPVAGKVAKWSASKALDGLESGVQALRAAGFKTADLAVDAVDAGAAAAVRNADAIGSGIQRGARGAADLVDTAAGAVANRADDIGGVVEAGARKVTDAVDERLLPKIREGLTEQTGRKDVIDEVFANTPEARAAREQLGNESLTGARKQQTEQLSGAIKQVLDDNASKAPMFDDIAIAAKRDLQAESLGTHALPVAHKDTFYNVVANGTKALDEMGGAASAKPFRDALESFAQKDFKTTAELYAGIDQLKAVAGRLSKIEQRAANGSGTAGLAADAVNNFRTFTRSLLEDPAVWGEAGLLQQKVNAAYSRWRGATDVFEHQFTTSVGKGHPRIFDGGKVKKWARTIADPSGSVQNAVVDEVIEAQRDLISLTEQLANKAQRQGREELARGHASVEGIASKKAEATRKLDQAEVLQGAQNKILSRQGAGVNPLPVDLARQLGGGALLGGAIGGIPGAVVGGAVTSALQKYGAITSNPKSAIDFLNNIDRLRKVKKEKVASWIKATMGETSEAGLRGGAHRLVDKIDPSSIADSVRRGAKAVQEATPTARGALESANKRSARAILAGRESAQTGLEALSQRLGESTPDMMRRLLPAISYSDVNNGTPSEWWARTQRALIKAQADPDAMLEDLERETDAISSDLPEMADAIAKQKLRVIGYLAERMPRNQRSYMLGDPKWTPDPTQMKAFRDLVLVSTQPDALLPLISTNHATRAQVDAVKDLWPKTFEETRNDIVGAIMKAAEDGAPVSYEARIRLGQLLGVPLDPSQERGFYAWLQRAPSAATQQQANPQQQQPQGVQLNINTAAMTPQTALNASARK